MNKILVTGGAGYIGSHTVVELLAAGYEVVILDNFVNSSDKSLEAIRKVSGKNFDFVKGDVRDSVVLDNIFKAHEIDAVIHFAGLKAVGESVQKPLEYYDNNLISTLHLLEAMKKAGVKKFVFSSSATVYGETEVYPFDESFPIGGTTNPYGTTKYMQELMLKDISATSDLQVITLRYFNPVGAHESGEMGEDPQGIPNNLCPFITQVLVGRRDKLSVFGGDYDTKDGTCIRDYIHVVDLAKGHVCALKKFDSGLRLNENGGYFDAINLGTGKGSSVLDMIAAFEKAAGKKLNYEVVDRRAGDIAVCYAKTDKAREELGFVAEKTVEDMAQDSWRWQSTHPKGFNS
ncbi:MAG: UDP-glucose 4-epimerase GalE [Candidatus Ancillula sp.]|jgi:UDP-glucose 4-epimerase|nr:UDP-glucose 4-epimerase GalE [Candidatus Ancillula sp.]